MDQQQYATPKKKTSPIDNQLKCLSLYSCQDSKYHQYSVQTLDQEENNNITSQQKGDQMKQNSLSTAPQLPHHYLEDDTKQKSLYEQIELENRKSILTPQKIDFDKQQTQQLLLSEDMDPNLRRILNSQSPKKLQDYFSYSSAKNRKLFDNQGEFIDIEMEGESNIDGSVKFKKTKNAAELWKERQQMLSSGSICLSGSTNRKHFYSPNNENYFNSPYKNKNKYSGFKMQFINNNIQSPDRNNPFRGYIGHHLGYQQMSENSSIDGRKENNYKSPVIKQISRIPFQEIEQFEDQMQEDNQQQNRYQSNFQPQRINPLLNLNSRQLFTTRQL